MSLKSGCFWTACIVLFHLSSARGGLEPIGRLHLLSVVVADISEENTNAKGSVNIYMKCTTQTRTSKVLYQIRPSTGSKTVEFSRGDDLKISLLSHESVECELIEMLDGDDEKSHGFCEYTYARFLAPEDNTVSCNLGDGSSFKLRLVCHKDCPAPVSPATSQYCKPSKKLQSVDLGKQHSFSDGSPGFALYAPNSECTWTLPRASSGTTNFLFTRFDLGKGDAIEAFESKDGIQTTFLRKYTSASVPESVSTSEKFLILKFVSDSRDEGLGFSGFYYYTPEQSSPVAIVPGKEKKEGTEVPSKDPRKNL